jgi:hypothetical protein
MVQADSKLTNLHIREDFLHYRVKQLRHFLGEIKEPFEVRENGLDDLS